MLWQLTDPEGTEVLTGPNGFVTSLAFSSDGRRLASSDNDGTLWVWSTDADEVAEMVCHVVWRNLSQEEWRQFVTQDAPYERTCDNLPPGEGVAEDSGGQATPAAAAQGAWLNRGASRVLGSLTVPPVQAKWP